MADTPNPWQTGPTELIAFALEHLHKPGDFNQRVAFLLLDVGVETLFKTFLTLPDRTTGTKLPFPRRKAAAEGNFHELCDGIEQAASDRLNGIDISHVQFYHDLRNRLYHQGNGITIPTDKAQAYASLAVDLLQRLLAVDLHAELQKPELEAKRQAQEQAQREQEKQEIQNRVSQIRYIRSEIASNAAIVIENILPELTLPSVASRFEEVKKQISLDATNAKFELPPQDELGTVFPEPIKRRLREGLAKFYTGLVANGWDWYETVIELDLDVVYKLICNLTKVEFPRDQTWAQHYRYSAYYPEEPDEEEYWFVYLGEDNTDWTEYRTGRQVAEKPSYEQVIERGDNWVKKLNGVLLILKELIKQKLLVSVGSSNPINPPADTPAETETQKRYDALTDWLRKRPEGEETLKIKFDEIERIIGQALPASAHKYREWWANHSKNSSGGSWLRGGWRVKNVSFQEQVVSFQRTRIGLVQPFFLDVMSRVKQIRPSISWETKNRMTQDWRLTTDRPRFYFYWIFEPEMLEMQFFVGTEDSQVNDLAYQQLFEKRDEIESQVGIPLNWQQSSDNLECRITASYPAQITDAAPDRERAKQWLIGMTLKFLDTFEPLIPHL